MLREIAARPHNETESSSSILGPDPQPSPTTPHHGHDFHLCKFTTCKRKELFEVPIIEDIMHVSIEMHVSSASPDWQTVQSRRRQRNFPSEIISCPMPEAGLNTPSASTEAGQGMVQLLVGADGGVSGLNEDGFFPQIVQGPRREAELALSRETTKEIWRTVRLSRPRDSAILGLREWENKKMLVRQVVWHKFARRIDSSHKRTWNEWLKEWELFFKQENQKVWQGQRRLDRDSRWQAMRNSVVFVPEGGCLYCADDKCNGCSGC